MLIERFSLNDKVGIVTGAAAGGIGEVYASGLAEVGAAIVCADIDEARAQVVARTIVENGGEAIAVRVDIADPDSTVAMAQAAIEAFGGIDILVNNAALMMTIPQHPLAEMPLDVWERVMRVNLTGALLCTQAVVPSMVDRGGGAIVNQASGGAWKTAGVYGISKLGVVALTQSLARELGGTGIRVNAIAPGITTSEAAAPVASEGSAFRALVELDAPIRSVGSREDLLGPLLLLLSDAGSWMTGQVLNVDGGWVMRT